MGKIIGTIIILGALIGVYFTAQEYFIKTHASRNPYIARMTPLLKMHVAKNVGTPEGEGAGASSFLTILSLAHQASKDGYGITDTVREAAMSAGATGSEASRIVVAIAENLQFASSMGVFKQPNNELAMERGDPPVATDAAWEGEPLVVGHLVSPVLAPEAANAIANLTLMPECARDLLTEQPTYATTKIARKWVSERLIYPVSKKAIDAKWKENIGR